MDTTGYIISGLGTALTIVTWAVKPEFITRLFRVETVTDFIHSKNLSDDFTIAIVDDDLESFPVNYIQNLGYKVKTFELVSFSEAKSLSKNDLILLDVKGVVKEDLKEGGAKLIKIIKEIRPFVPIVAVSSGYFHTELNDYFKTCDDSIRKPIDEYKIREILGDLKLKFYDANHIANLINIDIESLQVSNRKKKSIFSAIIKHLKNDKNDKKLSVTLHKLATTKTETIYYKVKILKDRLNHA